MPLLVVLIKESQMLSDMFIKPAASVCRKFLLSNF